MPAALRRPRVRSRNGTLNSGTIGFGRAVGQRAKPRALAADQDDCLQRTSLEWSRKTICTLLEAAVVFRSFTQVIGYRMSNICSMRTDAAVQLTMMVGIRPIYEPATALGMPQQSSVSRIPRGTKPLQRAIRRIASRAADRHAWEFDYDWAAIQQYYDAGHSYRECRERFGFAPAAWTRQCAAEHFRRARARLATREVLANSTAGVTIKRACSKLVYSKIVAMSAVSMNGGVKPHLHPNRPPQRRSRTIIGSKISGCSARTATAKRKRCRSKSEQRKCE